MAITKLAVADRDRYGVLAINFEDALHEAYPDLLIDYRSPGCWGCDSTLQLNGNSLIVPRGQYKSNRHYHSAGHGILSIETARDCKLNLRGKPLFFLLGYAYNGDYRSLKKSYYLFGQNEDNSFFLHCVRPSVGETGDLDLARRWMWELSPTEKLAARQGDLGFVPLAKAPTKNIINQGSTLRLGNHSLVVKAFARYKTKTLVLDPIANHHEHDLIGLEGWYDVRLAKAWVPTVGRKRGSAD